jgi:hypothetical protein
MIELALVNINISNYMMYWQLLLSKSIISYVCVVMEIALAIKFVDLAFNKADCLQALRQLILQVSTYSVIDPHLKRQI